MSSSSISIDRQQESIPINIANHPSNITTSELTKTTTHPKRTLIRVNSDEISSHAAETLNRLSTIPSSMTNRQHQANSLTRVVIAAVLIIACVLFAIDILSQKGQQPLQGELTDGEKKPSINNNEIESSKLSPTNKNANSENNEDTNTQKQQTEPNSESTTALPRNVKNGNVESNDGVPTSDVATIPYSIDLSKYWSQSGKEIFSGANPRSVKNGVYYENNILSSGSRKQSDIFKCYGDSSSKNKNNNNFKLVPQKSSKTQSVSATSTQEELADFYFQPPLVVQKKSRSGAPFYQYDIVIFPVGCFGDSVSGSNNNNNKNYSSNSGGDDNNNGINDNDDPASPACSTTSCKALATLSRFVPCGKRPIGLILGDNFYPSGLTKRTRGRLEFEFGAKFLSNRLFRFPWFGTVGNHDGRHANHQFRFDRDSMWVMPQAHHASPVVHAASYSLQVFFVSTVWGYDQNWPHMAAEAAWLDAALSASTADIKIVASHEPIYNFAGFDHSRPLIQHIDPILRKHGIPLWVCAHAHSIQMHRTPGGYYQLISAGFADNLHAGVRNLRPRGFFYFGRGATAVAVNASHVVLTAMDLNGVNVFNFAFDWRKVVGEVKAGAPVRPSLPPKATKNAEDEEQRHADGDYYALGGAGESKEKNNAFLTDEIGYSKVMWNWAKLCDPHEPRMKAWWCNSGK